MLSFEAKEEIWPLVCSSQQLRAFNNGHIQAVLREHHLFGNSKNTYSALLVLYLYVLSAYI